MAKRFKKIATSYLTGSAPKETDNPMNIAISHSDIGKLCWKTKDGTIIVCRSYFEYKEKDGKE